MTRFLLIVVVPLCVCLTLIFGVLVFGMMNAGVRRADIQFLYVRENSADDIFLYDTRTGIHLNLTRQSISAAAPRWSPDGEHIVFEAYEGRSFENRLYEMRFDGTDRHPLLNGVFSIGDSEAVWSPDGTQIAFSSTRSGTFDIYVYDTLTRRNRRVTTGDSRDISPAWSPDGSRLAFSSDRDTNDAEIFVYDLATDSQNVVTANWVFDYTPVWVDDERIVYTSARDGGITLYMSRADGLGERHLTPDFFWSAMASSLGDGRILFSGQLRLGDAVQIYLLDVDTGVIHQLTHGERNYFTPAWRP